MRIAASKCDVSFVIPQSALTPATPQFRISDSISDVHVKEWNHVAGKRFFLTSSYLHGIEQCRLPGISFRYAEVFNHKKLFGIIYFQLVDLSSREMGTFLNLSEYGNLVAKAGDKIHNLLFSQRHFDKNILLVCGSLLVSGNHGIACENKDDFHKAISVLPGIIEQIKSSLQKEKIRVIGTIIKDFYEDEDALIFKMAGKHYHRMIVDPNMMVAIDPLWNSMDDYLNALSAKYRLRANNALKKFGHVNKVIFGISEIKSNAQEMEKLYLMVYKKAPVRIIRADINYFISLKENLKDHFIVHAFYFQNKMIAFGSGFSHGTIYDAHFIGIDYHFNQSHSVYLNLLYHFIGEAINSGCENLYFGRTALEIKSTVGAEPHNLTAYLKLENNLLHRLIRDFVPSQPKQGWIQRNPFKT